MKFPILFFSFVLISREIVAQSTAFSVCPKDIVKKAATPLKSQMIFQIVKIKKEDTAKCYKLEILTTGATMQITQSMMYDGVALDHKYVAATNVNGTWDVKMNNQPSSEIHIVTFGTFFIIYSCKQMGALSIQPGVYSSNQKVVAAAEYKTILVELNRTGIVESGVELNDRTKCPGNVVLTSTVKPGQVTTTVKGQSTAKAAATTVKGQTTVKSQSTTNNAKAATTAKTQASITSAKASATTKQSTMKGGSTVKKSVSKKQ